MPRALTSPTSPPGTDTSPSRRTWPVTVAAVLLGWSYAAWCLFVAAINAAAFFGDQPSRAENIESGLTLATAAVPLLLLSALAVRWGSRWGILLLVAPSLLLMPLGLDWAGSTGDAMDPTPDRPLAWSDLGTELLRPSWVLAVLLLLALGASMVRPVVRARRARRTVPSGGLDAT